MQTRRSPGVGCRFSLAQAVCDSSIIVSTVPGFEERHVIARLGLYAPFILIIFQRARHEAEGRAETPDLKRLDADTTIPNRPKLGQSAMKYAASMLLVHLRAGAQAVNPGFEKATALVEKIQRYKLATRTGTCRDEGGREEKLATVREAADVVGVMLVVINSDYPWFFPQRARRKPRG
jgi:hypothetical protein